VAPTTLGKKTILGFGNKLSHTMNCWCTFLMTNTNISGCTVSASCREFSTNHALNVIFKIFHLFSTLRKSMHLQFNKPRNFYRSCLGHKMVVSANICRNQTSFNLRSVFEYGFKRYDFHFPQARILVLDFSSETFAVSNGRSFSLCLEP